MIKQDVHVFKGMTKDTSVSKFSSEYAFDAQNIRITALNGNTLLSVTNEKGNKEIPLKTNKHEETVEVTDEETGEATTEIREVYDDYAINGTVIGTCTLNDYLVLFITGDNDCILRLERIDDFFEVFVVFEGNLDFDVNYPIEAIGFYESPDIQKVYWVDGLNSNRVANIMDEYDDADELYFIQHMKLSEEVSITKSYSNGLFSPGTVQYAFSYYNLFQGETKLAYVSPLQYVSFETRGGSPEETISCSFTITIENVDTDFDYIRLYSIARSSLDGTPEVKRIVDLNTSSTITYTDTGTVGEALDSTYLLYVGGEDIVAGTMTAKDNTLFLGNITLKSKTVPEEIRASLRSAALIYQSESIGINIATTEGGYYDYQSLLSKSSSEITTFKAGETYRFGVQFQDTTGTWSEVVFIKDLENDKNPNLSYSTSIIGTSRTTVVPRRVTAQLGLEIDVVNSLLEEGFVKARGVVVYPSISDRTVIAQGIVCPTVFRLGDRIDNSPFAQSSWFSRPNYFYDKPHTHTTNSDGNYGYLIVWIGGLVVSPPVNVGDSCVIYAGPRTVKLEYSSWTATTMIFTFAEPFDEAAIPCNSNIYCFADDGTLEYAFNYYAYQICGRSFNFSFNNSINIESPAASWQTRTTSVSDGTTTTEFYLPTYGDLVEFRHNFPIPDNYRDGAEIQSIWNSYTYPMTTSTGSTLQAELTEHEGNYFIDQNIVTFHSPEVEFDTDVQNLSGSNLRFRIVGYTMVDSSKGSMVINANSTLGPNSIGAYTPDIGASVRSVHSGKSQATGGHWVDYPAESPEFGDREIQFLTYVWHRNGSLNNQPSVDNRTAVLSSKKISNLKYCGSTTYNSSNTYDRITLWEAYEEGSDTKTGITPIQVFNSDDVSLTVISEPENSNIGSLNYYGNVDFTLSPTVTGTTWQLPCLVLTGTHMHKPSTNYDSYSDIYYERSMDFDSSDGYPISVVNSDIDNTVIDTTDYDNAYTMFGTTKKPLRALFYTHDDGYLPICNDTGNYGTDPVYIKYNSTPHAVFALNYATDGSQRVMPTNLININGTSNSYASNSSAIGGNDYPGLGYHHFPWNTEALEDSDVIDSVSQDAIAIQYSNTTGTLDQNYNYPYFWIGELYRGTVDNRFGGDSEDAVLNNTWYPAGEPVKLNSNSLCYIEYTVGDTFLARYDCLKTYAATESTNNVTEVVSFMCETHVNLDGRYDRNRGLLDFNDITPTTVNLLNEAYNQKDNYFSYTTLDYEVFTNSYFPNSVIWSEEKLSSSRTDTWSSISTTSILDLDGDKGEIVSLNTFNNEIYCFQKYALSNIIFNSRVQIPTSDNVPIEITNSTKVDGKRYVSNMVGCGNKWSILETPSGIYFVDNVTASINLFDGSINSLSDKLGFKHWINNNNTVASWDPVNFGNFRTFYDKTNSETYFINKDTALLFSETLSMFVSFMDYGETPYMFNLEDKFYSIKDGRIWEQFAGDYNMLFGEYCPYSITFISNADEPYDKIFNNLEFRADIWHIDEEGNETISNKTFDKLEVWNEYQKGECSLTMSSCRPSSLKRKFRVWRANIPRANQLWNGLQGNGLDRIRNTWAYVKLSNNVPNTDRMEFHDAIVQYYI